MLMSGDCLVPVLLQIAILIQLTSTAALTNIIKMAVHSSARQEYCPHSKWKIKQERWNTKKEEKCWRKKERVSLGVKSLCSGYSLWYSVCSSMDTVIRILFSWFLYSNEINVCHNIGRVLPQMSSYCIFFGSMDLILSTALIHLPPSLPIRFSLCRLKPWFSQALLYVLCWNM